MIIVCGGHADASGINLREDDLKAHTASFKKYFSQQHCSRAGFVNLVPAKSRKICMLSPFSLGIGCWTADAWFAHS